MTLAAECTEKELKILKDEVRALHVSTLDNLISVNLFHSNRQKK